MSKDRNKPKREAKKPKGSQKPQPNRQPKFGDVPGPDIVVPTVPRSHRRIIRV